MEDEVLSEEEAERLAIELMGEQIKELSLKGLIELRGKVNFELALREGIKIERNRVD